MSGTSASAAAPSESSAAAAPTQRRVGRESLIYGLGMILSRLASFIMLPLYTRLLTPADYGLLQMLDMTLDVVSILVSVGATLGVMRFYFKTTDEGERRSVIASAFVLQSVLNLSSTLVLCAFAQPVWQHGLKGAGQVSFVWIAAANFTLNGLMGVPLLLMQMRGRAFLYSVTALAKLVVQLSLNILFLLVLRWGPVGILLSTMLTGLIVGSAAVAWMLRQNGLPVRRAVVRDLWWFGFPYQIVTAGTFILTFGDRFFLQPMWGLAAVGLYGFAYQFGFLLSQLGQAPYMRAWNPHRFEIAGQRREVRDAEYNRGFLFLSLISVTTAAGIAALVHPVLRVMSDRSFHAAADLVPWILLAYLLQGWSDVVQFGIDVSERTKYSTYATWISVVVIVALYALLIPRWGPLGAALATVISFAVRFCCFYLFAQRLWPVSYDFRPHAKLLGYAAAVAIAARFARPESFVLEVAAACSTLAAYFAAVWLTVLDAEQRRTVLAFAMQRARTLTARFAA